MKAPDRAKKPCVGGNWLQEVQQDGMAHIGASSLVGQSTVNVSKASERRSQTSLGTRPVNMGFISICIVSNSVNSPTSEGTMPLNAFPFNSSWVNFVNCPSSEGISPVNPLSLRRSTAGVVFGEGHVLLVQNVTRPRKYKKN